MTLKLRTLVVCAVALLAVVSCLTSTLVEADVILRSAFSKELKRKYKTPKGITCWTCHDKKKRGQKNGKKFRNELGKRFEKLLSGKKVTARAAAIRKLKFDDPRRIKLTDEMKLEFIQALRKLEKLKAPNGQTYEQAFKKGLYLDLQR